MQDKEKKYQRREFFEAANLRFAGGFSIGEQSLLNAPLNSSWNSLMHWESDGAEHAASNDAFNNELYEEQILGRIETILNEPGRFISRRLKAGSFRRNPLTIMGLPALPRSSTYLSTPDALAHYLSSTGAASAAGGAQNFVAALSSSIENIILLPEAVYTERFLLTHIHVPALRTLLIYLHPLRLNRARKLDLPERLGTGRRPGLLEDVIEMLPAQSAQPGARLHKFVLPLQELNADEIALMDEVQHSYTHKLHLDYERI